MRKSFILFFILCLWVSGCIDERIVPGTPENGNSELPDGRVKYPVYTESVTFTPPVTRGGAADENNAAGNMWVFVFDARTSDTLFLEAVKASDHEDVGTSVSSRSVILQSRTHPVALLILDNAPSNYFDGESIHQITDDSDWSLTPSTKLSEAKARLNTVQLRKLQDTVPYVSTIIPLSTQLNLSEGLTPSTNLGTPSNPLGLQRIVARLTVKKNFTSVAGNTNSPPFTLQGATVYNTPRSTSLFPADTDNSQADDRTNYIAFTSKPIIDIAAAVNDDTSGNPIYLYPSAEPDEVNRPFVLIQARFGSDAEDTYYKLALTTPNRRIERNCSYQLLINSCTGRGYSTIEEAMNAPFTNLISYGIEVTDLSSHDIIDNGQYFIGVSNSEYIVYGSGAFSDLVACTLYHNAPAGVTIRGITSSSTALSVTQGLGQANTPTDIKINLTESFVKDSLTIRIGNLTKVITVTRHLESVPFAASNEAFASDEFVYGIIPAPAPDWIGLSTNKDIDAPTFTELESQKGGIYIQTKGNIQKQGGQTRKATFYLSRRSKSGRVKVDYQQGFLNTDDIKDPEDPQLPFTPVVGAFWRKDQIAERLIRIARPDGGSMDGYWYASVIQYDPRWKPDEGDGVLMDTQMTKDPNVGWRVDRTPMEASVIDGYALESMGDDYRVKNGEDIQGYLDSKTNAGGIYFRVGLQKKYEPTPEYPARYAVILLMYTYTDGSGVTNYRVQRIFLRQGEDADYLYRPTETYRSTTGYLSDYSIGEIKGMRSLAVKWSPYNLTDPAKNSNYEFTNRTVNQGQVNTKGAGFTRYPSQGGYYFSFLERYAYNPTVYSTQEGRLPPPLTWNGAEFTNQETTPPSVTNVASIMPNGKARVGETDLNNLKATDMHEVCPLGYRTPRDYSQGWKMPGSSWTTVTALVENSEVRQSLFLHPVNGDRPNPKESNLAKLDNPPENQANLENGDPGTIVGVYADGFMDRRQLYTPYCPAYQSAMRKNSAAALGTVDAAYVGRLLYNPHTLASLFFPYTGSLAPGNGWGGVPYFGGDHVVYGTSTAHHDSSLNNNHDGFQLIYIGYAIQDPTTNKVHYGPNLVTVNPYYTGYASVIRCVKE